MGWRPSLEQRVEPQLRHHIPASRLLEEERAGASPWGAWGRILDPVVQAGVGWVQRISPGGAALDRKLAAAGLAVTSTDFRAQQVLSGAAGAAVAAVLALSLTVTGRVPVITGVALVVAGGMAGFLLREQLLSLRVRRRREAILSEFPSVAELFALSVGAGESAAGALERIAGTARGLSLIHI